MTNLLIVALLMVLGRAAGQTKRKMVTNMVVDQGDDDVYTSQMITVMSGYVKRCESRFKEMLGLKVELDAESTDERAAFEKGFLMGEIVETYRKAVVFTEKQLIKKRYLESERLRYLMYVQNAYIKVFHLVHMMHEINAKYFVDNAGQYSKMNMAINSYHKSWTYHNTTGFNYAKELDAIRDKLIKARKDKVDREKQIRNQEFVSGNIALTPRTSRQTKDYFPIQYGWDMDYYW